jgi:hypothetical protein
VVPAAVEGEAETSVAGAIASLKVTVLARLIGRPVEPSAAPTETITGAVPEPGVPRIVPCPPPFPHPVTNTVINNAMSHDSGLPRLLILFICFTFSGLIQENIHEKTIDLRLT